jgi:subtilisin-like proprotein convertase family protein
MRRLALLCPLALLALAGSSPAATRTYSSHQLHAVIPDGGTLEQPITVPDAGPVSFVAVGVRIVHPRDSDLTISLVSPRGTHILLSAGRGGDGANFGSGPKGCSGQLTWFESTGADAADPISIGTAPFASYFQPERSLMRLYGQEARGRWTLRITDATPGATGTLLCWQLQLGRNVVEHRRASHDGVSADLSFRESDSFYREIRITIRRQDRLVLSAPLSGFVCRGCSASELDTTFGNPLKVLDLDGNGEPEVLVDVYSGGAHCCLYTLFLRFAGRTYRGTTRRWGNVGYRFAQLDHDGVPEIISADDRFAYVFTSFAGSVFPVQIWHYERGTLRDVTSNYLFAVRSDAAQIWREYLRERKAPVSDVRGLLAAWLADEVRLGRSAEGWKQLDAAYRRGELSAPRVDPLWPSGRKYLRALRAFLVENGYAASRARLGRWPGGARSTISSPRRAPSSTVSRPLRRSRRCERVRCSSMSAPRTSASGRASCPAPSTIRSRSSSGASIRRRRRDRSFRWTRA